MGIIADIFNAIFPFESNAPARVYHEDPPPPKVIPSGWPPFYGRTVNDVGKFVVTVKCAVTGRVASTSLPAWTTEEECREDAWFRHADDPRPELADE